MRIFFGGTLKLKKPVGYNRENEKRGWPFQKACLLWTQNMLQIVSSKYTKKFLVGFYNNG
jgi:hypothetical protein